MVIIFCGIPGAGKTTIAKRLVKRLQKYGSAKLFISDRLKRPVYEKFFRLLPENLGKYDFLIFDATFFKKAWRARMKRLAKGDKLIVVYAKCPLPIAIQRNKKRHAGIPEKAVHIISANFEEPEFPDVAVNTVKMSAAEAAEKILNYALRNFKAHR